MPPKRRLDPRPIADRRRDWSIEAIDRGPALGPGLSVATSSDVARALDGAPSLDDWEQMATGIVPVFERRRPFPFDFGRPLRAFVPPGVSVMIAYDLGPGLMRISREVATMWPVSEEAIVGRAMMNLRERVLAGLARPEPIRAMSETLDDLVVRAIVSGEGWASTLLLVPDLLGRLFGPEPCLFVAPMRDLLIGLPADTDIGTATWWTEEFEALDPNCLCLEGFAWADGELVVWPLGREAATA